MPPPFFISFISYGKRDALYLGNRREELFDWLGMRRRKRKGTGVCLNTGVEMKAYHEFLFYLKSIRKEMTSLMWVLKGMVH